MASPKPVESSGPAETLGERTLVLPFVARAREISQLGALHAQRKHVLIIGPAGAGKSALVEHLCEPLSLLVSSKSAHLGGICEGIEPQLGLAPANRAAARSAFFCSRMNSAGCAAGSGVTLPMRTIAGAWMKPGDSAIGTSGY
jgi:hypothetical protein